MAHHLAWGWVPEMEKPMGCPKGSVILWGKHWGHLMDSGNLLALQSLPLREHHLDSHWAAGKELHLAERKAVQIQKEQKSPPLLDHHWAGCLAEQTHLDQRRATVMDCLLAKCWAPETRWAYQ